MGGCDDGLWQKLNTKTQESLTELAEKGQDVAARKIILDAWKNENVKVGGNQQKGNQEKQSFSDFKKDRRDKVAGERAVGKKRADGELSAWAAKVLTPGEKARKPKGKPKRKG